MGSKKYQALVYATLAAVFYAINIPASKRLFIIEGVGVVCGVRRVVAG